MTKLNPNISNPVRLLLILGDQLDAQSELLKEVNPSADEVIMIESRNESTYVWSHKAKIALFLSAMRHFAQELIETNYPLRYIKDSPKSIIDNLKDELINRKIKELVCIEPGEWRLRQGLIEMTQAIGVQLKMLEDKHFLCSTNEFKQWAENKKELRLEYFYRQMRKTHHVLLDQEGNPEGGQWNFDENNRKPFSKKGPGLITPLMEFSKDQITLEVIDYVNRTYPDHPGSLDDFNWPVTRDQALEALTDFVENRLANFGVYQDAMWTNTPFAWHSVLSAALNLKLLNPREVIERVVTAWKKDNHDLATVEGFIRQILGWREFVRGIYYLDMPKLGTDNFYKHSNALPKWYWDGQCHMNCMKDAVGQTLKYGYAHHIQRLMVTGNFALLAEILPQKVCEWYLAIYVDAIEWVELPNTAGMALFANGGRFTSKPYIASGAYIKRMSNYCAGCRYKPEVRFGEEACPMTTLYWNFLIKHQKQFDSNPRTRLMTANLKKISDKDQVAIEKHAKVLLNNLDNL